MLRSGSLPKLVGIAATTGILGFTAGYWFSPQSATPTSHPSLVSQPSSPATRPPLQAPEWKPGEPRTVVISDGQQNIEALTLQLLQEPDPHRRARKFGTLVETLQVNEFPECFKLLFKDGSGRAGLNAEVYIQRWAELAPEKAWEAIEPLPVGVKKRLVRALAAGWLAKDRAAAIRWAESLPDDTPYQNIALLGILSQLSLTQPSEAVAFLKKHPSLATQNEGWRTIINTLAAEDPRTAVEMTLQISEGPTREAAIRSLVRGWSDQDPEAALNWIDQLPPGPLRDQSLRTALSALAKLEPQRAADRFIELYQSNGRLRGSISEIATNLARSNMGGALQWADQLPKGPLQQEAYRTVLNEWASREPQEALKFALTQEDHYSREQALNTVLRQWATNDPTTSLQWIENNLNALTPKGLQNVISGVALQNPRQSMELASLLPEPLQASSILGPAISWGESNPEEAEAYMRTLPDGPVKERFQFGYIAGMASANPISAARKVESLPPGNTKASAMARVAGEWARSNPKEAIDWVMKQGEVPGHNNALTRIVSEWSRIDSPAAAEWVNTLPAGKTRDNVARELSNNLVSIAPETAISWAESISDKKNRAETTERLARQWYSQDPAAAAEWIRKSNLSPKVKSTILKR